MKNKTSIILGSASAGNANVHFRNQSFLTESNRANVTECIRAFCELRVPDAFHKLVIMTCWPRNDLPKKLWEEIRLNTDLISDEVWNFFVDELRYQYKIAHPGFMTEFSVPTFCEDAYNNLVDDSSEVAAYHFYKRANLFLNDHIQNPIGQEHISFVLNRLNWHSADDLENQKKQLQALDRIYLQPREARYFLAHIEAVRALLGAMSEYMLAQPRLATMMPLLSPEKTLKEEEPVIQPIVEPFIPTAVDHSVMELNLENILAHAQDFEEAILKNSANHLLKLIDAGFDAGKIHAKQDVISEVLKHHKEMVKAAEALTK